MSKDVLETYIAIAKKKGGKCLSKVYKLQIEKLSFECRDGHIFKSIAGNVKRGSWCPDCGRIETNKALHTRKPSMTVLRALAKSRGGILVTKTYEDSKSKLNWKCNLGHAFSAPYGNVRPSKNRFGTWCPYCKSSLGENFVRRFLEIQFDSQFPKSYPKWLSTGDSQLELDGYAEAIGIAFEHQGEHHFKKSQKFQGLSLKTTKRYDSIKVKLCKDNGVKLIVVPELNNLLQAKDLIHFLGTEFKRLKIRSKLPKSIPIQIYSQIYIASDLLDIYKSHCASLKISVLSQNWYGYTHYYEHKCNVCDHEFKYKAANLKNLNHGCPSCGGGRKNLFYLIKMTERHGWKLLDTEFKLLKSVYKWECSKGHRFEMIGQRAVNCYARCPLCRAPSDNRRRIKIAKNKPVKYTIQIINEYIQRERRGKCLSDHYQNPRTKIRWECHLGHTWWQTLDLILSGKWCPHCAGNARGTLEELKEIARSRGGDCLSDKYTNSTVRMKWTCKQKHVWLTTASAVKAGSWCKACYHESRKSKN